MHMETYPQLIPLVVLIPAIGAFINLFWGHKLGERVSSYVGITASVLSFIISMLIFSYLGATHGEAAIVDPIIFDGWIRIGDSAGGFGVDIPWQFRVDTLTAVMLLVVTGVGSLIHIYSKGYMHGDKAFGRFFAYLNMFLLFMLILVTGNNFLMMFVGWEGVGLMSFLLIGFWWDKKAPTGWKNSNAARKAMVANRIGDFGVIMATILIFWTFGTLNYYQPGEVANVPYALEVAGYISEDEAVVMAGGEVHAEEGEYAEDGEHSEDAEHSEGDATEGEHSEDAEHSESATADHSEEGEHGDEYGEDGHGGHSVAPREALDNSQFAPDELGVFGQTAYLMSLEEGAPERMVDLGPFELDIKTVLFLILVFLLLGVTGKSAQIPLFVWLPDAMAGPTPVSALMHAATMVTAGVFMLVRSNVFLDYVPEARFIVAVIGATTALMAGFIAAGQWDIKRVLAYSTVSQLGFMVAAVGLGAYVAAMFHLATHAVFKALLFLGSGSVIHGVEHGHHHVHEHGHGHDDHHAGEDHHDEHEEEFDPQDMRNMGGLSSRMPITFVTYLFGTFALAGLPFFAGFWSKDEILADAWHVGFGKGYLEGFIVLGLLLVAAFFTAFYMWRQIQMVFFGEPRTEAASHAPESAPSMTFALAALAFFSFTVGFMNVPKGGPFLGWFGIKDYEFKHWLETSIPSITGLEPLYFNWPLAIAATTFAFIAIFLAHSIYSGKRAVRGGDATTGKDPMELNPATGRIWSFANARMYWDETYYRFFEGPYNRIAAFFADVVDWRFLHDYFHDKVIKRGYDGIAGLLGKPLDIGIIDGAVNGVGWLVRQISGRMRTVQTGYVRTYAVALVFGVVAVVILMLLPLIQNGL
jgi:NADH:ubiquinone oxidoreductase subunit 5 (subunit L)/multisubunit Na+/H+ antiporter MnhA subunit